MCYTPVKQHFISLTAHNAILYSLFSTNKLEVGEVDQKVLLSLVKSGEFGN